MQPRRRSENARRTGENIPEIVDMGHLLGEITDRYRESVMSQLISKRSDFLKSAGIDSSTVGEDVIRDVEEKWKKLNSRFVIVPGKKVLRDLREKLASAYSINLTDIRIIDEFREDEIAEDLARFLRELEKFRAS